LDLKNINPFISANYYSNLRHQVQEGTCGNTANYMKNTQYQSRR